MKVDVNMQGMAGVLEALKKLPPEIVSKNGGVARKAMSAGANVIRNKARANLRAVTQSPGKTGESYGTGLSATKVISARRRMFGSEKGEKFIVTVKYENRPGTSSKFRKGPIKHNDIAYMLEAGTSKQAAEPWFRPAFNEKAQEAIEKIETSMLSQIDKIQKKLAAETMGKK